MRQEIVPVVVLALNTGDIEGEAKLLGEQGIAFSPSIGSEDGKWECNWICLARDIEELGKIITLAREHKQHSIFHVDEHRGAGVYVLDTEEYIGIGPLHPVDDIQRMRSSYFTTDLRTGYSFSA